MASDMICTYLFYILEYVCDSHGSTSSLYDLNGICTCKTNVIGKKCTSCKSGYVGFPNCTGTVQS